MSNKFYKKVKNFFLFFDQFGYEYHFKYRSQDNYKSICGGLTTILFGIGIIAYIIYNFIPFINRENMTSIYYTKEISSPNIINFYNYSFPFAFGINCDNNYNLIEYIKIKLFHKSKKKLINESKENELTISNCSKSIFYNKFDHEFDSLELNNYFCYINQDYDIQGIYNDEIFNFFEFRLEIIDENNFNNLSTILKNSECKFNFYYIKNAIDLEDFNNPIKSYILNKFFYLEPDSLNIMNLYFSLTQFESDSNIFLNNPKKFYTIDITNTEKLRLFKGIERFNENVFENETLGKIYLRSDTKMTIVNREYQKLNDFIADVCEILERILLFILIFVNVVIEFNAEQAIIKRIFLFKNIKTKESQFLMKNIQILNKKNSIKILNENENENLDEKYIINNSIKSSQKLNSKNSIFTEKNTISNNYNNSSEGNENVNLNNNNKIKELENINKNYNKLNIDCLKNNEVQYKFNFFDIFIISFFSCCICNKKLNKKKIVYEKAQEIFYYQMNILCYLKNMQIISILNKIILNDEQRNLLKFLSKPIINLNGKIDNFDSFFNEKIEKNEIEEFINDYKILLEKENKSNKEKRLFKLINDDLNNFIN